ncbi:divergent PAP2 family protein [Caproiciproducens sp.]|uniref:divergent PAP2 family protein n=1 Tax=Caproiciproducens sp. TaxID=1954376 RepID=UPI002896C4EB|nr:divergent PAP2 family protein [Caproiciproducens sp.]
MSNTLLRISLLSWFAVQLIKTVICRVQYKKWDYKKLFESGGMPSAHCAFVSSLTYGIACKYGSSSSFFTIALCFSLIVMYDAMGVRNEAGKHAKILNIIQKKIPIAEKTELTECLGHKPIEVFWGAVSGVGISAVSQMFVTL